MVAGHGTHGAHFFAVAAVSIDGFIARHSGDFSFDWTSAEDKKHLRAMEGKADVLLLARKTFEVAKKNLAKRNCIVLTRRVGGNGVKREGKLLVFLNPRKASLEKFVSAQGYKEVCVLGGRAAYNYCLKKGLLDDVWLTIEPVVFGNGISMFDDAQAPALKKFRLVSAKRLNKKGSLLLHYSAR